MQTKTQSSFTFESEYPYLAIDYDGTARESKYPCACNDFGRWFYKDFFKYDDGMRRIENYKIEDYKKIYDARK